MTIDAALDFGPATHLTCRACGECYPLGAAYACMECFGPLEVGYEIVAPSREDIAAGPPLASSSSRLSNMVSSAIAAA